MLSYIRPFATQTTNQTLRTISKPTFTSSISKITAAKMSTGNLNIETKDVKTAPGIKLSEEQNKIVGSVLDLFAADLRIWKAATQHGFAADRQSFLVPAVSLAMTPSTGVTETNSTIPENDSDASDASEGDPGDAVSDMSD